MQKMRNAQEFSPPKKDNLGILLVDARMAFQQICEKHVGWV